MHEDWRQVTVADLDSEGAEVRTGPFGTALKAEEYADDGVPVVAVRDIGYGRVHLSDKTPRVPTNVADRLEPFRIRTGDILFGRKGAVDRSALVSAEQDGWLMGSDCIRLRLPSTADSEFVSYAFRTFAHRDWMEQHATGTTMASLNQGIISRIPLRLPPVEEQRRIAAVLAALDDKIELNRRMNRTLEALAQALFRRRFVTFDGHDRLTDRGTRLGEIPEGWDVMPLDKAAHFLNGTACQKHPAEEGEPSLPVIKIRELRSGITDKTDRANTDIPEKYRVEDGDFLFSWSGSLLAKVWTGGEGLLNQHLFKVTSKRFPQWFVYHWVQHHLAEFQRIAESKATTMGHIKRRHLSDALVTVPPADQLEVLGDTFEPLHERQIANDLQSRTLSELRDALLPELVSGRLRVPETLDLRTAARPGLGA